MLKSIVYFMQKILKKKLEQQGKQTVKRKINFEEPILTEFEPNLKL